MEQKRQETAALSQKRYAIARCIKYVQLLLIVLIFFLPTLHFTEESKELKMEASSSFSVFQYIIGDTETKVQLKADGEEVSEDSLLNIFLKTNTVDIPYDLFDGEKGLIIGFQLAPLIVGLMIGFWATVRTGSLSFVEDWNRRLEKASMSSTEIDQESKDKLKSVFVDQTYITHVYNSFPKMFEFLEKFLTGIIFATYVLFGFVVILQETDGISSFDWRLQLVYPIIVLILLLVFINNGVINAVCSKDIRLIRSTGARFEESYQYPTIASDIKAITSLFQSVQAMGLVSENTRIETLKKYKDFLDQGVITQEEFDTKKAELLNQKTDQT